MLTFALQPAALVVLPAVFCISLWRAREPDRSRWVLRAAYTGAFLTYMLAVGQWDVVGVSTYVGSTVLVLFFGAALVWVARGYTYDEQAVELTFPLRDGWFHVGQGGNSTIINYHNALQAQRYALDIVELNALGMRARGFDSKDLSSYVIFGTPIHSPCEGRVIAAIDAFADQVPPASDKQHVAGNHVVISCKGALILLAHMQAGSVQVTPGATVSVGSVVGRVGNSGNTSEPHLHVHAVRAGSGEALDGQGMPILFDGDFLVRNEAVRTGPSAAAHSPSGG